MGKGNVSSKRISAFASFQHADFRWIWFGQIISAAGTQMQVVAISWHIYILTNSPVSLGLVSFARLVPLLIFSLFGGAYADAHDRRKILLMSQSTMMALAGILTLLSNAGGITVLFIYLISAALAAIEAFNVPAWHAIIPNLVPREHLMNALSLNNVTRLTATIVGPALAGFTIAWKGVDAVYLINMFSFVAVLLAIMRIKAPTQISLGASRVSISAMREGIRFVFKSEIIRSTTLIDFFSTFFSSATALLPIFAKEILNVGPQGFGILSAAESIGAVVAALAMSLLSDIRNKGRLVLYSVAIYALATMIFGGSQWFALSILSLALLGAGDTVSVIMRQNIRQLETPDHLRGRVNSVVRLFARGGPYLGNLEAGIVAAFIGPSLSVITGGIANLVVVVLSARMYPKLRNYES